MITDYCWEVCPGIGCGCGGDGGGFGIMGDCSSIRSAVSTRSTVQRGSGLGSRCSKRWIPSGLSFNGGL